MTGCHRTLEYESRQEAGSPGAGKVADFGQNMGSETLYCHGKQNTAAVARFVNLMTAMSESVVETAGKRTIARYPCAAGLDNLTLTAT